MTDLFTNQLFLTVWASFLSASLLKQIIEYSKNRKFSIKHIFDSGGFPSSHTALVSALFFSVGISEGWGNPITTIAGILAVIVGYDALNIRFQAGLHAQALNKHRIKNPITGKNFKENLGHSYLEVLGGLLLGLMISLISYYLV